MLIEKLNEPQRLQQTIQKQTCDLILGGAFVRAELQKQGDLVLIVAWRTLPRSARTPVHMATCQAAARTADQKCLWSELPHNSDPYHLVARATLSESDQWVSACVCVCVWWLKTATSEGSETVTVK